ncbi:MAG: sigma-70 family RNA polymerase sigma factor [Cyclobacteriaceae bacterium]|jgi:RNA polymerase sigma-70 factor (ECF subfamily)|nr:sigma-70 family RNA polymerase sigma factor [Cyclobacteriaceae bacterium]
MDHAQTIALYQPLLHRIAYNLVRCKQDAEDIVQETFLKWLNAEHDKINNIKAYLITAVTNNCLNHLNKLNRKKEEYLESVHLPEFILSLKESNFSSIDLDTYLNHAIKTLHQKLEPVERAVFLLKEVLNYDYDTLQETLGKKKDHCRQLVSRAKKKLADEKAKIHFEIPSASSMIESFKKACLGDEDELIARLKRDIWNKPQD